MVLDNCKFTYFDLPGRGEASRLALSVGNVKFIDDRVAFADWPKVKPTTPWGECPVLTLSDGTAIGQQRAILRLIGKETGLYPTDSIAAAKVDELMDLMEDVNSKIMAAGAGMEGEEKLSARKAAVEEGGKVYDVLSKVDKAIGTKGYTYGDSLTIADFFIYATANALVCGIFDGVPADAIDDGFPNLTTLRKNVRSHPAVCKFYDSLDPSVKLPASYAAFD